MEQRILYAYKLDFSQFTVHRTSSPTPPDGWDGGFKDIVAGNHGWDPDFVEVFEITNQNHWSKMDRHIQWAPHWQGVPGPDAVLLGQDFSISNGNKFFVTVVWEDGRAIDPTETWDGMDVVHLRNNQSVTFHLTLRRAVDGEPGDLVNGNRSVDIPWRYESLYERRHRFDFVNGRSQSITIQRATDFRLQGSMEMPIRSYRTPRYELLGRPLLIRQVSKDQDLNFRALTWGEPTS